MALNISDNLLSCRYAKWTLTILLCQSLAIVCAQTNVGTQRPKMDSVTHKLQEVVVTTNQILGSKFQAQNRTGSAYYLSPQEIDRKSTRLNSSHANISYAVFCLKKNNSSYTSSSY